MAISAAALETTGSNVDATSYASGSITPTANKLVLAWVYSIAAAAPNTPTATGCNLTWVEIDNQIDSASLRKITLFRAMGSAPTTGAVTFDFAGQTQTGAAWSIIEYTGTSTAGSNGSGAIVQSAKNATSVNATSLTVTLAAFGSATNATVGGFGFPLNTAGLPTAGTDFTRTGQRNQGTPNLSIGSEFQAVADTSVDMLSGAASVPWVGIAAELAEFVDFPTQSADFESGSSQYGNAGDTTSLSITGDISIEGWVKFESLPGTDTRVSLVGKWAATGNQRAYQFNLFNNSGTMQLEALAASDGAGTIVDVIRVNWTPSTGVWYHVAWTADHGITSTHKFYVDGTQQGADQSGLVPSMANTTAELHLASGGESGGNNFYDGRMLLVRVWSVVRTLSEISTNMCVVLGATTNLAAEWTLDNTLADNAGNGNTLTNVNTFTFGIDVPSVCSAVVETAGFVPRLLTLKVG